jgi:hypothetical protein
MRFLADMGVDIRVVQWLNRPQNTPQPLLTLCLWHHLFVNKPTFRR